MAFASMGLNCVSLPSRHRLQLLPEGSLWIKRMRESLAGRVQMHAVEVLLPACTRTPKYAASGYTHRFIGVKTTSPDSCGA